MTLNELRKGLRALGARDLEVSPAGRLVVDVKLGERHQKVRVREDEPWFRLESRICGVWETGLRVGDLTMQILAFNREQEFLGLGRDGDDYLVGRLDLTMDVAVEEVAVLLRRLARECDRWEARLTGMDR